MIRNCLYMVKETSVSCEKSKYIIPRWPLRVSLTSFKRTRQIKLPLDWFVLYLQLESTLFPHNNCVCFAYYCIVVQHLQVVICRNPDAFCLLKSLTLTLCYSSDLPSQEEVRRGNFTLRITQTVQGTVYKTQKLDTLSHSQFDSIFIIILSVVLTR